MIVFACFCPHPPLLVPSIGKENIDKLKKTAHSYEILEQNFYASKPSTALIISPHGERYPDAFSINLCDKYRGDFEEFGDFSTKIEFQSDYLLIDRAQRHLRDQETSVTLDTCEKLDHGSTVPLYLLARHMPNIKIMPVSTSEMDAKTHFEFGKELQEIIYDSNKRVAVIASGDLSHALSTESPAGFSENGKIFDEKIQEIITNNNTAAMLSMDSSIIESAKECGLRSLAILLGILNGNDYRPEILSYEAPLGVGYLTCNFEL